MATAGLEGEKLNKTLFKVVQSAADLGSVRNIPVADLLQKFASGLSGEAEPLKRLGIFVSQTTLQQEALSKGITKSVAKMTEQEKVSLRLSAILAQTAFASGDFAKNSESVAVKAQIQAARFKNLRSELGDRLLPIMERIQKVITKLLDRFNKLSPETKDMIVNIGLAVIVISGMALAITTLISGIVALVPVIVGLGTVLKFVFISNPIIAVITGIALVVWDLWKAFNGGDSVLKDLFDWFVNKFPEAAKVIIDTFKGIADAISNFFEGTQRLIRDTIDLAQGENKR